MIFVGRPPRSGGFSGYGQAYLPPKVAGYRFQGAFELVFDESDVADEPVLGAPFPVTQDALNVAPHAVFAPVVGHAGADA